MSVPTCGNSVNVIAAATGGVLHSLESAAELDFENTTLDTKIASAILKVLNKFGKWLLLTAWPSSEYDPTTGIASLATPNCQTVKGIPPYPFADKYIDGDVIRAGDLQTGVAANGLTVTPTPGNIVSFDDMDWKVVFVGPIYSGERVALYLLHLRK